MITDDAIIAAYNKHDKTVIGVADDLGISERQLQRRVKRILNGPDANQINTRPRSSRDEPTPTEPDQPPDQSEEVERLRKQLADLHSRQTIHAHDFYDKGEPVGIVSDTHLGSNYCYLELLEAAYDVFADNGVRAVYHCGDLLDGENMYRGQVYEISHHGADEQVKLCVDHYPSRDGITTHFITGNHDQSFYKRSGVDVGKLIDAARPDMNYLGPDQAMIEIGNDKPWRLMIMHPSGGTAYAISYKAQKAIESLSGGRKPNVLALGHYHKADFLPACRNVCGIQAGCFQRQTPYMATKPTPAHLGFWILDPTVNPSKLVSRFAGEFFAGYEETM